MSDWLHGLPVLGMAILVFGLTYLVTVGIYAVIAVFAVGERARSFKGTHAGLRRQTTSGGMSETGTGFPALMPRTLGGIFVSTDAHNQADFYHRLAEVVRNRIHLLRLGGCN